MSVRAEATRTKKRAASAGAPRLSSSDTAPSNPGIEAPAVSPDSPETASIRKIAHDFNNLLTLVLGYGEALLKWLPEGHPGRAFADEISRAANEGVRLSVELSSIARLHEPEQTQELRK